MKTQLACGVVVSLLATIASPSGFLPTAHAQSTEMCPCGCGKAYADCKADCKQKAAYVERQNSAPYNPPADYGQLQRQAERDRQEAAAQQAAQERAAQQQAAQQQAAQQQAAQQQAAQQQAAQQQQAQRDANNSDSISKAVQAAQEMKKVTDFRDKVNEMLDRLTGAVPATPGKAIGVLLQQGLNSVKGDVVKTGDPTIDGNSKAVQDALDQAAAKFK